MPILIPRTSSRLQGLGQLPGFIPSLAPQPDPRLVVWQQEVSVDGAAQTIIIKMNGTKMDRAPVWLRCIVRYSAAGMVQSA